MKFKIIGIALGLISSMLALGSTEFGSLKITEVSSADMNNIRYQYILGIGPNNSARILWIPSSSYCNLNLAIGSTQLIAGDVTWQSGDTLVFGNNTSCWKPQSGCTGPFCYLSMQGGPPSF